MQLKSKVGPKGETVIPKVVRDTLGIVPGDHILFELSEKEAKLKLAKGRSGVSELVSIVPRKRESPFHSS